MLESTERVRKSASHYRDDFSWRFMRGDDAWQIAPYPLKIMELRSSRYQIGAILCLRSGQRPRLGLLRCKKPRGFPFSVSH
jgi:hypothetical protein